MKIVVLIKKRPWFVFLAPIYSSRKKKKNNHLQKIHTINVHFTVPATKLRNSPNCLSKFF